LFPDWTVDSYASILAHLHSKDLPRFHLLLEGSTARIVLINGGLALQNLGRKRERWATQLSRTPNKASARGAEQHSTPNGSSLVTLAKLELPRYSPTCASG
jgi:hypothetical protein